MSTRRMASRMRALTALRARSAGSLGLERRRPPRPVARRISVSSCELRVQEPALPHGAPDRRVAARARPSPHAQNSSCIYDVRTAPIRLKATVPDGVYWSIAFHGRNQACHFTLNDTDASTPQGSEVEVVLTRSRQEYQGVGNEIVVEAPCLSRVGLILIRTDPAEGPRRRGRLMISAPSDERIRRGGCRYWRDHSLSAVASS